MKEYALISTNFWLTLCPSVASADHLCKQFGPRSGPINCRSKLFDTLMVSLKDFSFEKVNFDENKNQQTKESMQNIRITCPCDLYPLTPHFYIVKLGFTRVYIIFLFLL